jgi:hypothetical protein
MVSMSQKLRFVVCHEKSKEYLIWMENPLSANGAEVFRISGDI